MRIVGSLLTPSWKLSNVMHLCKRDLLEEIKPLLWMSYWERRYRSRLRKSFCKNSTKMKFKKHKIPWNKYVFLIVKSIKKYFKNISEDGFVTNKIIWNLIQPSLASKGHINKEEIIFKTDNKAATNSSVLAGMFNSQ